MFTKTRSNGNIAGGGGFNGIVCMVRKFHVRVCDLWGLCASLMF